MLVSRLFIKMKCIIFENREFLQSVKCMEEHENQLIPSHHGSSCSRNKAFYYYYGDLAARLQLSINVCEYEL